MNAMHGNLFIKPIACFISSVLNGNRNFNEFAAVFGEIGIKPSLTVAVRINQIVPLFYALQYIIRYRSNIFFGYHNFTPT